MPYNSKVFIGSFVAFLYLSVALLLACGKTTPQPPPPPLVATRDTLRQTPMMAAATVVDPFVVATGVSGTYTVPRGYVVSISAVAASGLADAGIDAGGYGTITITPDGPSITDGSAVTQPPIPIPAGYAYSVSRPVIQGSTNELGTGTVIVFSNTVAYTVTMSLGGT
jgi:hypothetical protein